MSDIRYERIRAAAVITIDRPQRRNAIDGPTAQALEDAFSLFESDPDAKALVITGAGEEAFCAGADLKALESLAPRLSARGGPLGFTRFQSSKPTIAAISGWCLAGGLEIALWCDLRIAAKGTKLGFTERRFGVPLVDGGTQRLPRVIGLGRALHMILTGKVIDAEEALCIGLINEIVDEGRHLERALQLADSLASVPERTMRSDRAATLAAVGLPLSEGLELEANAGAGCLEDALAGAARFVAGQGRGGEGSSI